MKRYDPLKAPDLAQWRAIDEEAQLQLVEEYHRRARIRLPNLRVHAVIHVTVENQIALGDEIPVERTLRRMIAEGLDRHQAIHAVGMVLAGHINDLLRGPDTGEDPNIAYYAALEKLTAKDWLRSG